MLNLKKIYSGFVKIVVIFLALIAANSLVAKFIPAEEKAVAPEEIQVPAENLEVTASPDLVIEVTDINATDSAQNEISTITYESQAGDENAFDLLMEAAEVEYKEYDFGVFVESVNGIEGDDKHFWAFYLNGEQAQAGADQTTLQKGDKVEWRYEEIK